MLQNPVILYSLQSSFSLNCKSCIFHLCNISLPANNVDFHHRLNPHFPFSLIGNVFTACDCTLSNSETVWYFPTTTEESLRGESRRLRIWSTGQF